MVDINFVDPEGSGRIGPAFMVGSWNRDKLIFNTCTFKSTGAYPEINRGHGAENFDARMTFTGCTFQQLYKGLRFEGSTNVTVSESNTFSSTNSGTYGVIIKDSYGNASEVTRNTFTNVDFGVQTEQNNTGLQIRCNGYAGNDRAWSINPASVANTPGLFSDQGACGISANQAGNLFNDPDCPSPGVAESHIRSKVTFQYRSRSGGTYNANEIPTCVSNGSGGNGTVQVQFCGNLSGNNPDACTPTPPCDPPCAIAIMEEANNSTETWTQQSLYNKVCTTKPSICI